MKSNMKSIKKRYLCDPKFENQSERCERCERFELFWSQVRLHSCGCMPWRHFWAPRGEAQRKKNSGRNGNEGNEEAERNEQNERNQDTVKHRASWSCRKSLQGQVNLSQRSKRNQRRDTRISTFGLSNASKPLWNRWHISIWMITLAQPLKKTARIWHWISQVGSKKLLDSLGMLRELRELRELKELSVCFAFQHISAHLDASWDPKTWPWSTSH